MGIIMFVMKKNPYNLEQEMWVQIRVQTVLKKDDN